MSAPYVTGLGCISAVAKNTPDFWQALRAGKSGIRRISSFARDGLATSLAGEIRLSPALWAMARDAGITSRLLLFACSAIDEALADAGIDIKALRAAGDKVAMVVGTSLGMSLVPPDPADEHLAELGGDASNPDLAALAAVLEHRYSLLGDITIVSTACASATHAIGLALDMIRYDGYRVVIAGGADSLDRMKYLGHSALSTLTPDLPRPFALSRSGTLFGEGSGFLVLQAADQPPRGAYATCDGAGYSTDIHHVTAPDPEGVGGAAAIRAALADAGLTPDAIGHVNLHGSGTALNDSAEFAALATVFGGRMGYLPCTSIKAAVGHAMGAAGGLEAVATVLSLLHETVPPTLNVAHEDVAFPLDLVVGVTRPAFIDYALSNSFGFGGANGTLIFGRCEGGRRAC